MLKALAVVLATFVLASCCSVQHPSRPPLQALRDQQNELAHDLELKAVALVAVGQDELLQPIVKPYCSGTWIGEDLILSAWHCIESDEGDPTTNVYQYSVAAEVTGRYSAGWHSMTAWRWDPDHDLVVFKAKGLIPVHRTAHVVVYQPEAGDLSYTMGNPGRLWFSFSSGEVSAVRRFWGAPMGLAEDLVTLQTTNRTAPGSSGGGLFDVNGDLMGVCRGHMNGGGGETAIKFFIHVDHIRRLLS